MPALFFDCSSGISGDMTVGALLDAGADADALRAELAKLGLSSEFHVHVSRQSRQMIEGTKFVVHVESEKRDHGHGHVHSHEHGHGHTHSHTIEHTHHHAHEHTHEHGRNHREIRELIGRSALSEFVKTHALGIFQRIAVAEGRIHGRPPEDVGFHEVGAVDSIVDIVAACVCLEQLGCPEVIASYLFDGTGSIRCAHGNFPLPAPATLEILTSIPIRQIDEPYEFITPTGAAILAEFSQGFGPMPLLSVTKIGYGIGTRDLSARPNVLRVVLGERVVQAQDFRGFESDSVIQIETNIDDMTPELLAGLQDTLIAEGALDAFLTPVHMKKSRPGFLLTVVTAPEHAERLTRRILTQTTAFGLRYHRRDRWKLRRDFTPVSTEYGDVVIKRGFLGPEIVQLVPEYESCASAARRQGVPVRVVFAAAYAAARDVVNFGKNPDPRR